MRKLEDTIFKKFVKAALDAQGYQISRLPAPNTLFSKLKEALELHEFDLAIDIGGHYGDYGAALRELGYQNRIISFEPVPQNFQKLKERSSTDSQWSIENAGAGDIDGTAQINVLNNAHLHSFAEPNEDCVEAFGEQASIAERVDVPVHTIASYFKKNEITFEKNCLLKIDTQGWEMPVLKGCGDLLKKVLLVQLEAPFNPIYKDVPPFDTILDFMIEQGFQLAGVYPIRTNGLKLVEADCIFINSALC